MHLVLFTLSFASFIGYVSVIARQRSFINGSLAASVAMLIDATLALLPNTTAGASSFDYFLTIGVGATISLEVVFATGPYIAIDLELTWPMNAEVHHLIKVGEHTSVKLMIRPSKSDCTRCMHGQLMFLHSC